MERTFLFDTGHDLPGAVAMLAISIVALVLFNLAARPERRRTSDDWRKALGLENLPAPIILIGIGLWLVLFLALVIGLLWSVLSALGIGYAITENTQIALRFVLITITALTATLGALVAFPFTLIRTQFASRTTRATEEGLITDRINAAVQGLGAEKEVNRIGRPVTIWTGTVQKHTSIGSGARENEQERSIETESYYADALDGHPFHPEIVETLHVEYNVWPTERTEIEWRDKGIRIEETEHRASEGDWQVFKSTKPNLEVRIGAILALERLARQNLDVHVQIMQILCAYVRENAPHTSARELPDLNEQTLEAWKSALPPIRTDIMTALEVIERRSPEQRRTEAEWGEGDGLYPFNRNLPTFEKKKDPQSFRGQMAQWRVAVLSYHGYRPDLSGCNLQAAYLADFDLRGWLLIGTRLECANLGGAMMQGSNLRAARLNHAYIHSANLEGAVLDRAELPEQFSTLEELFEPED